MLSEKIRNRETGIITYGMTPPKETYPPDQIAEISRKQCERLEGLPIDGLILYDVQEESDRIDQDRPFPYLRTVEPTTYSRDYLSRLSVPKIIYRCVGKDSESQLSEWLQADPGQERFSVFVGASSSKQAVSLTLPAAYELSSTVNPKLAFGGVVIPERHQKKHDEHLRIADKIRSGCQFFISQAAYNVEAAKDFLSDYYYHCQNQEIDMVPILINLAPCGSAKTLDFMKWLGISIPKWLENDLKHSNDVLDKSIRLSQKIFEEIFEFGLEKGIPLGCSVESVSTRKVEIEASIQLVHDIKATMEKRMRPAIIV
ncbi:5,10-methylenetetrahydrofolate reductase [Paenibacillus rhizovicinus]|uniref:Methylenetetrahydrofolate reductase n=1 Tax=Paenibacillus rhizovicinus TaxID=2704463 RepID=A0A6C0P2S9_9BACL|nr:methylenetetrahydrofolate reductase [Paenibacillus rhizovicinus]QHW32779.1 5,10-methylenetetrahydrofolate reductase [Paenibacillus rhizovicinus]